MNRFVLIAVLAAGCGKEIGDACVVSSDCDPSGARQCDSADKEGYCTIQGCNYDTCPSEGTCVQFFTGGFDNRACNPTLSKSTDTSCSLDELCAIDGHCVPRSSELRFCMKVCQSDGDCRDGYECRNLDKMKAHGGQPVLAPGLVVDETSPNFCAAVGL